MLRLTICIVIIVCPVLVVAQVVDSAVQPAIPPARDGNIPRTRWEHVAGSHLWTRSALAALKAHGRSLERTVPADIGEWCPAYPEQTAAARRAFWVGLLSALAKYESTYRPDAVGGGGRWYGLLQILPATARHYRCRATNGAALKHGPDNLSCAIRIMARTVPRDGVVARGKRGVAADWGPLHHQSKRDEMKSWTRRQSYCRPMSTVRPRTRPAASIPVVDAHPNRHGR